MNKEDQVSLNKESILRKEKTNLPNPLFGDEDVRRLQIAVNDWNGERVHVRQCPCAAPQNLETDRVGEPVLLVRRGEATLGAELEHDADLASFCNLEEGQNPDNVRVSQLEDELDLFAGLARLKLAEHLERDGLVQVHTAVHVCSGALYI